jgi:hypothetical protein
VSGKSELDVQYLIASLSITWVEDVYPANVIEALRLVRSNETVRRQKQLTDGNRPLGVVVSERGGRTESSKPEGRAVVIGNGTMVSDAAVPERSARHSPRQESPPRSTRNTSSLIRKP